MTDAEAILESLAAAIESLGFRIEPGADHHWIILDRAGTVREYRAIPATREEIRKLFEEYRDL
ncbi:hypothetical protein [Glycomyces buryatensis]|uniref:Type II toxin-antitoxin system HicA family toxin n=1 Tax=Glycomyces buryatensis TaxID=2570927 RepID=A0A4S8Q828_9ACTN|nr:hypothetical protein [Glycomyces buryatensis]THV40523.1 hypothetical protein FAB82_14735 [Glycomyces buryatensis]